MARTDLTKYRTELLAGVERGEIFLVHDATRRAQSSSLQWIYRDSARAHQTRVDAALRPLVDGGLVVIPELTTDLSEEETCSLTPSGTSALQKGAEYFGLDLERLRSEHRPYSLRLHAALLGIEARLTPRILTLPPYDMSGAQQIAWGIVKVAPRQPDDAFVRFYDTLAAHNSWLRKPAEEFDRLYVPLPEDRSSRGFASFVLRAPERAKRYPGPDADFRGIGHVRTGQWVRETPNGLAVIDATRFERVARPHPLAHLEPEAAVTKPDPEMSL